MIDAELYDALDAYSQRLKVLSEQATTNNDEATCEDIDLVFESLAAPATSSFGLFPHNERMAQQATSRRFSAFDVSNAILDILDDGHIVNGLRYGWKFDYPDESRADAERLDFRDLVLARLKR